MSRVTLLLPLVLLATPVAGAADLPPGAVARLGDARFRAGAGVTHVALSPDGKRFATARAAGRDVVLAVWDSATGRPLHERRVSAELFRGLVWGKDGAFAVARCTEPAAGGKYAKVVADDFQVWDITDPDAAPPQPLPVIDEARKIHDAPPQYDVAYSDFQFSADGSRVAALWAGKGGKYAVHVFELKPAKTAAKLDRVSTIDLGAEGAGAVRISADGRRVVTFRRLVESDSPPGAEYVATVWDADAGKPSKPARVSSAPGPAPRFGRGEGERITNRLMLTPNGRGVVTHAADEKMWGFDRSDVGIPAKRRELLRLPHGPAGDVRDRPGTQDSGAHCFFPSGDALAVAFDRQTVIFDCFAGKALGRLEGHAEALTAVAVSADGSTIATADRYGLVRLWEVPSARPEGFAKTFRPRSAPTGHTAPIQHADLSPDGKRLLTWATDETVRLWDIATGKELRAFAGVPGIGEERFADPTFTPDGTAVLFSTAERLVSRDLATTLEIPLPGALAKLGPRHAKFAADGKTLLTWTSDAGEREAWDWATGKPAADAKPAPRRLTARSAGGGMEARGNAYDGAVRVTEDLSGGLRRVLSGRRGGASVLGFTPDGSRLLTADEDHTVLVWDMRLASVPLPDALKTQTNAAKLWAMVGGDDAEAAYLAMARLAREPDAAVKLAALKLKPATPDDVDTDETRLLDARAIELLEALPSDDARKLLKELAGGEAIAFRTVWAKQALERLNAAERGPK